MNKKSIFVKTAKGIQGITTHEQVIPIVQCYTSNQLITNLTKSNVMKSRHVTHVCVCVDQSRTQYVFSILPYFHYVLFLFYSSTLIKITPADT